MVSPIFHCSLDEQNTDSCICYITLEIFVFFFHSRTFNSSSSCVLSFSSFCVIYIICNFVSIYKNKFLPSGQNSYKSLLCSLYFVLSMKVGIYFWQNGKYLGDPSHICISLILTLYLTHP